MLKKVTFIFKMSLSGQETLSLFDLVVNVYDIHR